MSQVSTAQPAETRFGTDSIGPEMLRTRIGLMTYLAPKGTLSTSTATERLKESVEACLAENEINLVIDMGMRSSSPRDNGTNDDNSSLTYGSVLMKVTTSLTSWSSGSKACAMELMVWPYVSFSWTPRTPALKFFS